METEVREGKGQATIHQIRRIGDSCTLTQTVAGATLLRARQCSAVRPRVLPRLWELT